MDNGGNLAGLLKAHRGRIRFLLVERMAMRGIAWAGGVAGLLVLVDWLTVWYVTPEMLALVFAIGALVGVVMAARQPLPDLTVAMTVEARRPLKESVSTAICLRDSADSREFCEIITGQAQTQLAAISARECFPLRFGRRHHIAFGVWGLAILLFLLPSIPWLHTPQQREERAQMQQEGGALQKLADQLKKDPLVKKDPQARELARRLEKLAGEMRNNRISKKEALRRLNKIEEQLAKLGEQRDREMAQRDAESMRAAADAADKSLKNRSAEERAAAARAREKQKRGTELSRQERQALAREEGLNQLSQRMRSGDRNGARESLRQMGKSMQNSEMTPEERQQAGEDLQQISEAMNESSETEMSEATKDAGQQLQTGTAIGQRQAGERLAGIPSPVGFRSSSSRLSSASEQVGQSRRNVSMNRATASANGGQQGNSGQQGGNGGQQGNGSQPGGNGQSGNGEQPGGNGGNEGNQGNGGNAGSREGGSGRVDGPGQAGGGPDNSEGGAGGGYLGDRSHGRQGASTVLVRDPAQVNRAGGVAFSSTQRGAPDQVGQTNVPYSSVYTRYRQSAESAINSERIPPGERQRVKEYFEALEPK